MTSEIQWQRIEDRMKTPGKSINRYMDYAYSWIGWGHHGARTFLEQIGVEYEHPVMKNV